MTSATKKDDQDDPKGVGDAAGNDMKECVREESLWEVCATSRKSCIHRNIFAFSTEFFDSCARFQ